MAARSTVFAFSFLLAGVAALLLVVKGAAFGDVPADTLAWAQNTVRDQRDLANTTAYSLYTTVAVSVADTVLAAGALNASVAGAVTSDYIGAGVDQALDLGARRIVVDVFWSYAAQAWLVCEDNATAAGPAASGAPGVCAAPTSWQESVLVPLSAWITASLSNLAIRCPVMLITNVHLVSNASLPAPVALSLDLQANLTAYLLPTSAVTTSTGWLTLAQLFQQPRGLLMAGFGTVSAAYNTSADSAVIFPTARIDGVSDRVVPANLTLCPVSLNITNVTDPAGFWVATTTLAPLAPLPPGTVVPDFAQSFNGNASVVARNCNNMPLFTQVTNGSYIILAGAWSWALSQPTVSTTLNCAQLRASDGFWVAADCTVPAPYACVTPSQQWSLATGTGDASAGDQWALGPTTCPIGTVFAVPRNARSNQQILSVLRASAFTTVWIDFTDAVVADCWVPSTYTCPYARSAGLTAAERTAVITVSVVGGVVILLLSSIFLYYKFVEMKRYLAMRKYEASLRGKRQSKFEPLPS